MILDILFNFKHLQFLINKKNGKTLIHIELELELQLNS